MVDAPTTPTDWLVFVGGPHNGVVCSLHRDPPPVIAMLDDADEPAALRDVGLARQIFYTLELAPGGTPARDEHGRLRYVLDGR